MLPHVLQKLWHQLLLLWFEKYVTARGIAHYFAPALNVIREENSNENHFMVRAYGCDPAFNRKYKRIKLHNTDRNRPQLFPSSDRCAYLLFLQAIRQGEAGIHFPPSK